MNPSFLTACVAARLRDRSRPRIALAKCSRNDFDGQATKAAHAVSTAPPSLLWHVRGDPLEICHGVSSSKQSDDCAQARIARNFGQRAVTTNSRAKRLCDSSCFLPMLRPQPLGFPRLLEHELGALGNGQFERDEFAGLGMRNSGFLRWILLWILRVRQADWSRPPGGPVPSARWTGGGSWPVCQADWSRSSNGLVPSVRRTSLRRGLVRVVVPLQRLHDQAGDGVLRPGVVRGRNLWRGHSA